MAKSKWFVVGLIVGVVVCAIFQWGLHKATDKSSNNGFATDTIHYFDTIPVYQPVPKDSLILKYKIVKLPYINTDSVKNSQNIVFEAENYVLKDSVDVIVPIEQKIYSDSTYKAYVSGYMPSLDSIFIYPRRDVITIRPKPKRWSVGVTGGIGITPHGADPFIGIGLSYSLYQF